MPAPSNMVKYQPDANAAGGRIRLVGRDSRLSRLQLGIVAGKIRDVFPAIQVEVIARCSRGDVLQNVPLHTVEGSDFFTQDIFDALQNGEADIAVHSLKDMSSEHFFGENRFAVVDRADTRDVVVLHKNSKAKMQEGEDIVIGTCSPRREEMAIGFLQKALPQTGSSFKIVTRSIRGNVDTRLRKLDAGEYDGIILATAGLNRLLNSPEDAPAISGLLQDKQLLLLPLVECVPAPCQGAIVAEAYPANKRAIAILDKINNKALFDACAKEKRTALQYGKGCLQQFGVTTFQYAGSSAVYAAGRQENGEPFATWYDLPAVDLAGKNIFSAADHMGGFFAYEYAHEELKIEEPVVYVANYKAIQDKRILDGKRVWAAGSKTWYELARQGIMVEGCADAFGLEFLEAAWAMPLFKIGKQDVRVITSESGAENWQRKGWKASGTYTTKAERKTELLKPISEAAIVFWTSFQQYDLYKDELKEPVQHLCPSGETALLLRAAGVEPVIFPTIKSFQQWKKIISPLPSAG